MSFTATESSFDELMGSVERKYVIPRYQREYSWGVDNLATFWSDIHDEDDFFFGSVVLKRPERRRARIEIIDGQQRMLTMTILYAAIRDVLNELGELSDAATIHSQFIITRRGRRDNDHIIQPTQGLRNYFERSVQSLDPDFRRPSTKEEKRVKKNHEWFKARIYDKLENRSHEERLTTIDDLIDKVGRMQLIQITVTESYDAYRIFETVNATGVDLSVADLIKNMVFKHIREDDDTGEDPAQIKWTEMKNNLAEINLDVARFVRYHWISSRETVTMGKLYKSVKNATTNRAWQTLMDDLVHDSTLINHLMLGEIPNENMQGNISRINRKLKLINGLGFSQCYVLLLSVYRNMERLNYSWDEFEYLVSELENFNFIYHTICTRPANRVENFYSQKAILINQTQNDEVGLARFSSNIESVYTEFISLKPNRSDFIQDFTTSTQYSNSKKRKSLLRYILGRFEEYHYPEQVNERPIDDSISIEHFLPQSPEEHWGLSSEDVKHYVHLIGNLFLVGQGFNSSARNFSIQRKIVELRNTGINTTAALISEISRNEPPVWTENEINLRTNQLAELAYDVLWSRS
ncbi:MAG: DUF262 domain-containing protein [Candidatus Poseidoniaceae archaeon]